MGCICEIFENETLWLIILTLLVLPALYVIFRDRTVKQQGGADEVKHDGVSKRKQAVANKVN